MLNMFDSIKNYLMAFLLITTLSLGWSTYHLVGKVAVAEASITRVQNIANANAEAVRVASESCAASLSLIQGTQKAIDALNESRTSDLDALNSVPHITLPEIEVNGTTKPTEAPKKHSDDLRLSPDTMRLLDNAYCSGNKDDPYCTSR